MTEWSVIHFGSVFEAMKEHYRSSDQDTRKTWNFSNPFWLHDAPKLTDLS